MGNVDLPDEIVAAARNGARGCRPPPNRVPDHGPGGPAHRGRAGGLFPPGERFVSRPAGGDSDVSIWAATNSPPRSALPPEANPFLGWRSIRVCLDQPEIFRPQLRAVLRAAVDRRLQLMLPLVTRVEEVLRFPGHDAGGGRSRWPGLESGLPPRLPIGVMIETPAAVLIADISLADVQRLLQRRHQRPDAVHPGGGPGQCAARRPLHAAPSGRAAPAQDDRCDAGTGTDIGGERVRRDGIGSALGRAAHGPGLSHLQRGAAVAPAAEVGGAERAA